MIRRTPNFVSRASLSVPLLPRLVSRDSRPRNNIDSLFFSSPEHTLAKTKSSISTCMERTPKRVRRKSDLSETFQEFENDARGSISPPPMRRSTKSVSNPTCPDLKDDQMDSDKIAVPTAEAPAPSPRVVSSPFELTHIQGFPDKGGLNEGTVKLRDILGDPLIKECWQFNYCFDVDFVMAHFDPDVRSLVKVKIVHGSWEKESANRINIDEACARYPNVEAITAYMPERFGTHHSKMMILFRHDDQAQIIIHTANMIPHDWMNMTQAVWRSPLLPLFKPSPESAPKKGDPIFPGTGLRFKRDLIAYLAKYGAKKTGPLFQQLSHYDFSAVRAALVASVPDRKQERHFNSDNTTLWGWLALKDVLSRIPTASKNPEDKAKKPRVVIQVSSIATLGVKDTWLAGILFKALSPTPHTTPKYSIIFPTPDDIRQSLDGYNSGTSIHMKTETAPQQKQLQYLRPYLCHWGGGSKPIDLTDGKPKREAGRGRAAPHIKTYIRFSDENMDEIDWALLTSANLSTQAWGKEPGRNGEIVISSYEIGVLVWPGLYSEDFASDAKPATKPSDVRLAPCFKQNLPHVESLAGSAATVVGLRMPYNLPLSPYGPQEKPWCATASHSLPDWRGVSWVM